MKAQLIQSRIYDVRQQKVMLDFDLAQIFGTDTRSLKQAVRRNKARFPADFMFQLNRREWKELITNCDKLPDSVRFSPALPYAFSEHGATMLSSILKSKKAIRMNILVVRAFIALKQIALNYRDLAIQVKELQENSSKHSMQLNQVFAAIQQILKNKSRELIKWEERDRIGFKK